MNRKQRKAVKMWKREIIRKTGCDVVLGDYQAFLASRHRRFIHSGTVRVYGVAPSPLPAAEGA